MQISHVKNSLSENSDQRCMLDVEYLLCVLNAAPHLPPKKKPSTTTEKTNQLKKQHQIKKAKPPKTHNTKNKTKQNQEVGLKLLLQTGSYSPFGIIKRIWR